MFAELNYLAIGVSTIAVFIIAFFWYGPLFGKVWMKAAGIKGAKGPMLIPLIRGFLNTFVLITVTSYVISLAGLSRALDGALLGLIMALGFHGTYLYGQINWERKPFALFAINLSYFALSLAIAGGIYAGWPS